MKENSITSARLERALAGSQRPSSDYDLNPQFIPVAARHRPASVLIPLIERQGCLLVVLTRRSSRLKHHPGQVSLPGGKVDAADISARDTALREAEEEIGLNRASVRVLGTMAPHLTVTGFEVQPFVGLIEGPFVPLADAREVAEIFEVPLDFLTLAANYQVHGRVWHGQQRRYYAIPWGPHYIWGATARILRALADLVQAAP